MTSEHEPAYLGDVPCARHPKTMTRLRCSRCNTPICPQCAVRTPVGLRCPECAGVRALPSYATPGTSLLKAAGVGLVIALVFAGLFAWLPDWNFYLSLALGFGVAEAIAWAAKDKRGTDLQLLAIGFVILGMAAGRALLAWRLDLTWDEVNTFTVSIEEALKMQLAPDGLFAVLTVLIPWYRFR